MPTSPWVRPALLACALIGLAGCLAQSGGDTKATKAEPRDKAPTPGPAPAKDAEPDANDGFGSEPPAAPGEPAPPPPWFAVDAFEHVSIIRQDQRSNALPTGQSATMIVLELPAGTTPEQCIDKARAKLGETIDSLPATATTPQGYLTLGGKGPNYEFSVVCGVAKDKPTMFMSYIQ